MVTLQSVQGHTGLTHPKKAGLDQYGAERFGRLICGVERVNMNCNCMFSNDRLT